MWIIIFRFCGKIIKKSIERSICTDDTDGGKSISVVYIQCIDIGSTPKDHALIECLSMLSCCMWNWCKDNVHAAKSSAG